MKKRKLTPKQEIFVREYLVDLNATRAAERAGYKNPKYGRELLAKTGVREAVQKQMEKREKKVELNAEMILKELMFLGFSDITDFIKMGDEGITFNDFDLLPEGVRRCISEISQHDTQNGKVIKFKLYDKVKSLELLGKNLAMWIEKHQHDATIRFESIDKKLSNLTVEQLEKLANDNTN